MTGIRLLPAGENALLLEAPDDISARALFASLQQARIAGVVALRPAARTVHLGFDPLRLTRAALHLALRRLQPVAADAPTGRDITIPLRYDGPDLAEVAGLTGLDIPTLVTRHQAATFTVAFTGFVPGFGYMTCDDPAFTLPRRAAPRPKIRAGAVALAGGYGAVYPADSPGGWQIIGHTDLAMWDADRPEPALLRAGDRVRFVATSDTTPLTRGNPAFTGTPCLDIAHALLPLTLQDRGRRGHEGDAISPSGAMDRDALDRLNAVLGNTPDACVAEMTGPVHLVAKQAETLAFAGAAMELRLQTADGKSFPVSDGQAFAMDAGDRLAIGAPMTGVYGYLGRRGGFDGQKILGARSHDSLSGIGAKPLGTGDRLYAAHDSAGAVDPAPLAAPACPRSGATVTLPLLPGPRMDWFTDDAIRALCTAGWTVTPAISRVGLRLSGPAPLTRRLTGELASEAVIPGAIQVPHDGKPLVFMRDAPVTGGYPVIAIIPDAALSRLAQCPPGTRLRFALQAPFAPETLVTDLP